MNVKFFEGRQVVTGFLGLLLLSTGFNAGAAWVNATGNLAGMASECGDIQSVWAVPNVNKVVLGVANVGLYATTDGSAWSKISGNVLGMRLLEMHFDPTSPNTWYAGGIYHSPGIGKTTDGGATWVGLGNIGTNDGFAVDFSDPQRKLILAGGHEASNVLWKSTDGGATWANTGGLGVSGFSSFPVIINTQTWLMGISNGTGGGVYKTVNGGGAWTKVCPTTPITHITKASTGEFYFVGGSKVVKGSADGSTWTTLTSSFNAAGAAPIELPGGKIAAIAYGGIAISADKGVTWVVNRCSPLPTVISGFWNFNGAIGMAYNSVAGAFYTFYWGCGSAVGPDEVQRFDTMIAGGTEVTKPLQTFQLTSKTAHLNGTLFDVAGRSIQHAAFANKVGAVGGRVYLVKNSNGKVTKQLFTKN